MSYTTALQSLKEYYEEQRGRYESPTELEMRVYHRLIHIRDQRERHEEIPIHVTSHPVFKLTTDFRLHVQNKSAPISKTSALVVDAEGMQIFGQLASVLREQGSVVMIYLVACILERLFGKDTIEDIEAIRGELGLSDIIDGKAVYPVGDDLEMDEMEGDEEEGFDELEEPVYEEPFPPQPAPNASAFGIPTGQPPLFGIKPSQPAPPGPVSAFASLANASNGTANVFGGGTFGATVSSQPTSVFGNLVNAPALGGSTAPVSQPARPSLDGVPPFGGSANQTPPSQPLPPSVFGKPASGASTFSPFLRQPI